MLEHLSGFGPLVYPLVVCSSLIVAIILERSFFLAMATPVPEEWVADLSDGVSPLDKERRDSLERNRFGRILLDLLEKGDWPEKEREGYFTLQLSQVEQALSRSLPLLRILATISPLLGLLGTVFGMIEAFDQISMSHSPVTPALVADGISNALVTTAAGLIMAIPALLAHSLFQTRVGKLIQRLTLQLNTINLFIQARHRKGE